MGLVVVILGLVALSLYVFVAARRGRLLPAWRPGQPISRRRIAGVVVVCVLLMGAGWLLFNFVWWYLFGCCKP